MCLDTVDSSSKEWHVGYKVFTRPKQKRLHSPYCQMYSFITGRNAPYNEGVWLKDKSNGTLSGYTSYLTGFHFFRNKKDAIKRAWTFAWSGGCVRKVRVRKLTATGTQGDFSVGVAREIFIEAEDLT